MKDLSAVFNAHPQYIDTLYHNWLNNPDSVETDWQVFFKGFDFALSAANVSDNDQQILDTLFNGLEGKCYGDKGYLTKLFEKYYMQGIQIITKLRKNMKNKLMQFTDKLWLRKRAVIESVNDILMTVFDVDHTRHRSPINAMAHIIGGVIAYSY